MKLCVAAALTLLPISQALAQTSMPNAPMSPTQDSAPSTRIERLLLEKTKLVTKDFARVGQFSGFYGSVSVEVATIFEPASNTTVRGARVVLTNRGVGVTEASAFLDPEEVDELVKALTFIDDAAKRWTADWESVKSRKDADKEAHYRETSFATRGDLRVGYYREGKRDAAVFTAGRIGSVSVRVEATDLTTIRDFVLSAQKTLNETQ